MTQHWASCSIVVCSLLALPPFLSASPAPRTGDPCKQLQRTLDRQIDDAKDRQQDELAACELSFGRKSDECRSLKDQQTQELHGLRSGRAGQMTGCKNGMIWSNRTGLPETTNYQYAQENDYYKHHHHHHHHHPYPHDVNKPASAVAGKTDKPPDKNASKETARTEHSAQSESPSHSTSHSGASDSAQPSSGHSGSASSGSSYSGGGGGGSSYSGSSSGGSSHSSGGGGSYSGSSSSGSSYSGGSSSSAPAASQSTGGGHPK